MEQRELRNTPLLYVYSRADEKISPLDRQGITQLLFFLIGQGVLPPEIDKSSTFCSSFDQALNQEISLGIAILIEILAFLFRLRGMGDIHTLHVIDVKVTRLVGEKADGLHKLAAELYLLLYLHVG